MIPNAETNNKIVVYKPGMGRASKVINSPPRRAGEAIRISDRPVKVNPSDFLI